MAAVSRGYTLGRHHVNLLLTIVQQVPARKEDCVTGCSQLVLLPHRRLHLGGRVADPWLGRLYWRQH